MGQVSPLPLFEVDLMGVWPWPLVSLSMLLEYNNRSDRII